MSFLGLGSAPAPASAPPPAPPPAPPSPALAMLRARQRTREILGRPSTGGVTQRSAITPEEAKKLPPAPPPPPPKPIPVEVQGKPGVNGSSYSKQDLFMLIGAGAISGLIVYALTQGRRSR